MKASIRIQQVSTLFWSRLLRSTLATIALMTLSLTALAKTDAKQVLMVLSSHGEQQGEVSPGYEFDEFAKAYLVFKANGVEVSIASPKGGTIEADKYNPAESFNAEVLADDNIMDKLRNTKPLASVKADQFDGIFVVGGKGAMFDLPNDKSLQQLIADIYEQEGSVAAVCHGPAALVNVQLSSGEYLVAGKAVNGFTNEEEQLFGKKWMPKFEFMLQDKLIERGGKFQSSPIMLNHVASDKRLITGQNPSSTIAVAEALVKSMGSEPVEMAPYRDDMTLALVADLLAGDDSAAEQLVADPEQYHIELVGMYGYYYLNVADTDGELEDALTLMSLAKDAINNPQLDMQIAKTQQKLGKDEDATTTLNKILASHPEFQPALDMLQTLSM